MRIAILTYSRESNCGAILQAWALKRVVENHGHTVEMPLVRRYASKGRWYGILLALKLGPWAFVKNLIYQCFTLGIKEWVNARFKESIDKIFKPQAISSDALSKYDLVIIGSDQVWNPNMGLYKLPLYLGEVIPRTVPLVGYAVSTGDAMPDNDYSKRFARALKRFTIVFAREQSTCNFLFRASGMHVSQVLDPSLLLSLDCYKELEEGVVPNEPYVFFYVLATNAVSKFVPEILKAVGVQHAVFFDGSMDFVPHKRPKGYRRFISPGEFVKLARCATAIVACSFHGTAFAVLSKKPFVSLTTRTSKEKQFTRQGDFLSRVGCQDRIFSIDESK